MRPAIMPGTVWCIAFIGIMLVVEVWYEIRIPHDRQSVAMSTLSCPWVMVCYKMQQMKNLWQNMVIIIPS